MNIFSKKVESRPLMVDHLKKIELASKEQNAQWWLILNRWEWPLELDSVVEDPPRPWHSNTLRRKLMDAIDEAVGHRYILYYANVIHRKAMTDEEFSEFWTNRHIS